jgi:hypothetical protein
VTDASGDADRTAGSAPLTAMKSTDIIAADLASTPKYLTAAVHLADLYSWHNESPSGVGVGFTFVVGDTRINMSSYDSETHNAETGRPEFSLWRQSAKSVEGEPWTFVGWLSGEWDEDSGIIYITSSLQMLKIAPNSHATATMLQASSGYAIDAGVAGTAIRADHAESQATYRLGTRSCSRVPVEPCLAPEPPKAPPDDNICPGGA